ncbi:MAG: LptA/OstA family protein [Armatimonadota bacterium]
MARRVFIVISMAAALSILAGAWLFAQGGEAGKEKAPPFTIQSDYMSFNIKGGKAVYSGHVKFVSPQNATTITCGRLEANSRDNRRVTSIVATETVVFTATETNAKEKTKTRIDGKSEKMTYTLENGERVIRMVKFNGVLPTLAITDLNDSKATPDKIIGETIEYNIDSGNINITKQVMIHDGGAQ